MSLSGYKMNGKDLRDEYGIEVEKTEGMFDFPARKGNTNYSWDDEDGVQAFTDADDIFIDPRPIRLICHIKATSKSDFENKWNKFQRELMLSGSKVLQFPFTSNAYVCFYDAGSIFAKATKWNNTQGKLIGTFTVPFIEKNPPLMSFKLEIDEDPLVQASFTIKGTADEKITIFWGELYTDVEEVTFTGSDQTITHDYTTAGAYTIVFSGRLNHLTKFQNIQSVVSGDIANLSGLKSLTELYLYSTSVSGDIRNLSELTALTDLRLNSTSVSGDIANLSGLTALTILRLYSTSVSGDIADLAGLTALTILNLRSTSVSGDIGDLSGLTSLIELYLYSTSVSGDIADLSGLTALTLLRLYSTSVDTYTTGALPAWAECDINIKDLGLDQTEVDNFINDLADGVGADGTLDISGTNAARSAASDAGKAALISAGWSVTVNE